MTKMANAVHLIASKCIQNVQYVLKMIVCILLM
jgi:hypothetical protein